LVVTGSARGDASENAGVPWPAADALGRTLPTVDEVGPPRTDRFVGIFYFLWLNQRDNHSSFGVGPNDVSKILAADPDALQKPDSPLWGPPRRAHYWGEPLFGYYLSDDEWVIRRHAQLLADAGVDTLIFDATNAVTYRANYLKLCEVFSEIRKSGGRTPQIAFMVNTKAHETADEIYRDLYEPGLYRELWFNWRGKPLLLCDPSRASDRVKSFFTLRRAHWPFTMENTKDAWHWEATYPQPFGYADDDARTPEQVNVSVAQNLGASGPHSVQNMSSGLARGRGFHDGVSDHSSDAVARGMNFEEQWKRALKLDPPFVMVTGWNEWIAGRFRRPGAPVAFVDQFNEEFSRDIEPMKGGHGDNFYYHMIAGIRRYKGMPPVPKPTPPKTIDIAKDFDQWRNVGPEFIDDVGDTAPRDHDGAGGLHYSDHTGRHDFALFKVARDASNVYFYARTRDALETDSFPAGMSLLIDADQNASTGWAGYDYRVAHGSDDGGPILLLKSEGNAWKWSTVTKLNARTAGNELHLCVPGNVLRLRAFDFKWTDNFRNPGDVTDFYLSRDVAPEGRLNYRFLPE
jgi:hypothetical protein